VITGITLAVLILIICLSAGFPFYLSLLASGSYLLIGVKSIPPPMVINGFYEGVSKISLVAVPFFLLAGSVMQHTSIGRRLIGAVLPWVHHFRGGVALTGVISNEIFGAMSGSSPAAVGTIGRFMMPMVAKVNGEKLALGLFASSGSLAIIMPPSINMIIFAAATNTSTGALFLGGVIPSFLIVIILAAYIMVVCQKGQGARFSLKEAVNGIAQGVPALLLPPILLGGIYTGAFTPTEAGIISAAYTIIVALILKEMTWDIFKASLDETVRLTAQIFVLIGASTVFSQGLAVAGIPKMLANAMGELSSVEYLLILNIILLIAGCFFEPGSAIIILAPVLVPIGVMLGLNPWHIGIVFTVNLAIGMFTPPFGFNLFVMQSIFKIPLEKVARACVPYIVLYLIALVFITYIPQLSLWLPMRAGY